MADLTKLAEFHAEKLKAERLIAWFAQHMEPWMPCAGYRALMFTIEKDISIAACRKLYALPDSRTVLWPAEPS